MKSKSLQRENILAQAANGVYDLQLQLFDATVDGRAQALNAEIPAGEDGFFEIGVRPGKTINRMRRRDDFF